MNKILKLHWLVFLVLAILTLASPRIISAYLSQSYNKTLQAISPQWNVIYFYVAIVLFVCMGISFLLSFRSKKKFYSMADISNLRNLNWQEFEELTAQIMRSLHYKVYINGGAKADGGIDLTAYKKGFKYIIQCKHWKSTSVGVKVVREMFGVSIHEKASGVYIFTCGNFTKDAREFAKDKKVYLINGYQISKLIAQLKAK